MPLVSKSPFETIQASLLTKLEADAPLMALLVGGVFDEVRENVKMPYVRIGELHSIPKNTHTSFGREVSCTVHSWADDGTNLTVQRIGTRIQQLLDHRHFEFFLDDHFTVAIRMEFDQILKDPKPHVRHYVQRFRITTQQDKETVYPVARWGEAVWA